MPETRIAITVSRKPPVLQPVEYVTLTLLPEDAEDLRRIVGAHSSGEHLRALERSGYTPAVIEEVRNRKTMSRLYAALNDAL